MSAIHLLQEETETMRKSLFRRSVSLEMIRKSLPVFGELIKEFVEE